MTNYWKNKKIMSIKKNQILKKKKKLKYYKKLIKKLEISLD